MRQYLSFSGQGRTFSQRPQLGLRGTLILAFGSIAAMAIFISIGAGVLLGQLSQTMGALNEKDIPRLTASLQLATLSQSLAAKGPMLLNVQTELEREIAMTSLKDTQAATAAKLNEVMELGADSSVVAALSASVKSMDEIIARLSSAAKDRLRATADRERIYETLTVEHEHCTASAGPEMADAQAKLASLLAASDIDTRAAAGVVANVERQSSLNADTNALAAIMMASLSATSSGDIKTLKDAFAAKRQRLEPVLKALSETKGSEPLYNATTKLLAFGEDKVSVFSIRQSEIEALQRGELILDETRRLNLAFEKSVNSLVQDVQAGTGGITQDARNRVSISTKIMLALGVLTLLASLLFVRIYVGGNILRRIGGLQKVMQRLADGDLDEEVVRSRKHDEIAAMAISLETFRDSLLKARKLSSDQDRDRKAKADRALRMEKRIEEFEATVRAALKNLETSASSMQSIAKSMSATADRSSSLVNAVASAAEETSINVQTVSAGTEELSQSIDEIGRQVVVSTQIASQAVSEAAETDATMQGLADNASRISVVVDLIQNIASQTNLLALNATIEAARAGEAGRGFAVVASEVKNLASQTANATEEIRSQIANMQHVTTTAVSAIRNIGNTIGKISEVTTTIASAVEEQNAATREMTRNVQHAAGGTSDVSRNIVGVSAATTEAGSAASEVLNASSALHRETESLRAGIDAFLTSIRAA